MTTIPRPDLRLLDQGGATNNQGLVWNSTLGIWVPATVVKQVQQGTGIAVDNTDPSRPIVSATGGGGGSPGTVEVFDTVVTAVGGAVHRWKFEETSGATIADSIGSLNLTLTGTDGTNYVRNIAGPPGLGKATQFISAHADSSGIGSVPVGAADRTVAVIYKTTSAARMFPFCYGTNAAYQLFYMALNDTGNGLSPGSLSNAVGGTTDLMSLPNVPISDGDWHLAFIGLRGGTGKDRFAYEDGVYGQSTAGTAGNTVSTGFFRLADAVAGGFQYVGYLADVIVFNKALSRAEMDRLTRAATGVAPSLYQAYEPGSADTVPSSPNAKDDEFDGSSSATWTATPTAPNTWVVNTDRASHLHVKSSGTGAKMVGRYQAAPAFPCTITAKLTGTTGRANFHRAGGLVLYPASPTTSSSPVYFGAVSNTGIEVVRVLYSGEAGFASQSTFVGSTKSGVPARETYLRAVFTDATHVSFYFSSDGFSWILAEAYTVPFTVANIGLGLTEEAVGGGVEAYFDFFRVT